MKGDAVVFSTKLQIKKYENEFLLTSFHISERFQPPDAAVIRSTRSTCSSPHQTALLTVKHISMELRETKNKMSEFL